VGGFSNFNTPQASTCPVPLHLWQGFSRSSSPVPPQAAQRFMLIRCGLGCVFLGSGMRDSG
jgi:hypothetical protein